MTLYGIMVTKCTDDALQVMVSGKYTSANRWLCKQ
jgi:hypothetical protein